MASPSPSLAALPSVDRLLQRRESGALIEAHGRPAVTGAIRAVLAEIRASTNPVVDTDRIVERVAERLEADAQPSLRPVFNLTGTVLHTNLGRAQLPEEAIEAMAAAARNPVNLEYDLAAGRRGKRDAHVEGLLCRLTGAEAATVVNNNAAAVLLMLNTLAARKEVPTSRGELIEIGGAFRLPDIMARSGCRLREVGTTNRTHLSDYAQAIGPKTGLVLKVHTSNYSIEGFTASVAEKDLSTLCRERNVPFAVDLGSGTLVDLSRFGLPHEPTVEETLKHGADLVTFSGDKLLGGAQAGIIAGRAALVEKMRRNPLKRALRVDKVTLAALCAVLRLYSDPDRLAARLPTLRLLTRPVGEIRALAARVAGAFPKKFEVSVIDCESEIGSGALPEKKLPSAGLAIRPGGARTAASFRSLPIPVIGRLQDGAFILDLRCLEDESAFASQLSKL
ncbi:MAG: L-seryl-tRNA(Sec) selenium transferase [Betaproteobacteria bacterium]|nr:MAG: L-seryl-tRNA(Sec) selenium transferase [Betaproteobacteria bacterium]